MTPHWVFQSVSLIPAETLRCARPHLGHGLLVHIFGAVVAEQQSVSLQGLQGFGGARGAVVSLQSLGPGPVRPQQADDVLSGLRRHTTESVMLQKHTNCTVTEGGTLNIRGTLTLRFVRNVVLWCFYFKVIFWLFVSSFWVIRIKNWIIFGWIFEPLNQAGGTQG